MIIILIRLIFFTINTFTNIISFLILNITSSFLILILQGLRVPGQAVQTGLNHVAEGLKSVAQYFLQLVWEALGSLVSAVIEAVFDAIIGSISATGSAVGGIVEMARESAEVMVKEYLPEIGKEVSELAVKVVSDVLENYKDAIGLVVENVLAN
ncbi:hypothetical protein LINPERPRIM_LOCUS13576 [Linum perenne]